MKPPRSFGRLARPPAAAGLLACLLAFGASAPARAQVRYPRLGVVGVIHGDGAPYLDANGALVPSVISAVARYEDVILDASPVSEYHHEIPAAIRALNPNAKMIAYVCAQNIWGAEQPDSAVNYPTRFNHMIRRMDAHLYDRNGNFFTQYDVNIAKVDLQGHYVVADSIAALWADAVVASGVWDGMFVDVYCDEITSWMQTPAESIDFVRAGYPDQSTFDVGWRAGCEELATRLRSLVGPDFLLTGNCSAGTKYATFNGWNREDFPYQGGGDWYTNMFRVPGGYLYDENAFRAPVRNHFYTRMSGTVSHSLDNARKVRLGLASAALATGFSDFGPTDNALRDPPEETWWFDEYSVDTVSAQTQTDLAHTGWLGQAIGPPYEMVWAGTQPDASTNPTFESDVTSGWSFHAYAPAAATIAQDVSAAAPEGVAACHIAISAIGTWPWDINLATTSTLPIVSGQRYSATFWARTSVPRTITVVGVPVNGGDGGMGGPVAIDTTWHHYQLVLTATKTMNLVFEFFLDQSPGDLWLDDVHFQQGETSFWRRDFEHGAVIINPADVALQAPLERPYRHVLGTVDPAANDGSVTRSITLGPLDAVFLIGPLPDTTPPAAIHDAHLKP